jgi:hypothetical protein
VYVTFQIKYLLLSYLVIDEEEESSSAEEVEEDGPGEIKLPLQEKPSSDKVSAAKESEAGAEISALVNYVQPVHFLSFENSESKYLIPIGISRLVSINI